MPHLLFRGVTPDQVRSVSTALVDELAVIADCPREDIMLDCLPTVAVFDGEIVASFPFVEVAWFDRGAEVRNLFAKAISDHLRSLGFTELEVAFRVYEQPSYYADGVPFGVEPEDGGALEALTAENRKLKEDLRKARQTAAAAAGAAMSTRLRDALRE